MPVDDDGADVGGEAVGGRECGDGDEGYAHVEGVVPCEVHERAAADGDDDVGVIELGYDAFDEGFFGVQALGLEDYFLIGPDVDHTGQVVCIGVVEHGTPSGEAAGVHVSVEVFERVVFDDDHLGFKGMHPAAGAGPGIFCAIKDHVKSPFKKAGGVHPPPASPILAVTLSYVLGKINDCELNVEEVADPGLANKSSI